VTWEPTKDVDGLQLQGLDSINEQYTEKSGLFEKSLGGPRPYEGDTVIAQRNGGTMEGTLGGSGNIHQGVHKIWGRNKGNENHSFRNQQIEDTR